MTYHPIDLVYANFDLETKDKTMGTVIDSPERQVLVETTPLEILFRVDYPDPVVSDVRSFLMRLEETVRALADEYLMKAVEKEEKRVR